MKLHTLCVKFSGSMTAYSVKERNYSRLRADSGLFEVIPALPLTVKDDFGGICLGHEVVDRVIWNSRSQEKLKQ